MKYRSMVDRETGLRKQVELPKRIKPWWFQSEQGKVCVSVKYGSWTIELAKGKPSVEVAKRYGIKFIDRDGLVDHMNMALGIAGDEDEAVVDPIMECLEANICSDYMDKVHEALFKIANQIPLTEDDVWIMQEASSIIFEELGFSFDDSEISNALIEACDQLGIKYNGHSGINSDSPIRPNAYRYH
jgi:hypothetical protein